MAAEQQSPSEVIMVRPAAFGFDQETAQSNVFQHDFAADILVVYQSALREFDETVKKLHSVLRFACFA